MINRERALKNIFRKTAVLVVIIFSLELLSTFAENSIFPKPSQILSSFIELFISGELTKHVTVSIYRVVVGFSIAAFLGVITGILFAFYRRIDNLFRPIIEILRPIPPIAWIPIAILLFGIGNTSSFFIVFLGSFFPIFLSSYYGALSIPQIYKNVSQTFELKKKTYLIKILFFYSLPFIFTGLKVGIGMAWMSVIAAEMIGSQSGLGYFIQLNRLLLRSDNILLGMILIGLIGFFLSSIVSFFEKKIIPWKR